MTTIDLKALREKAEAATRGAWDTYVLSNGFSKGVHSDALPGDGCVIADRHADPVDVEHIAAFDPPTALAVLDEVEALRAQVERIKARREEVGEDEGWWIGGAWGDYGETVVPLRILSYVIDGELDQKVTTSDPGFALTYAEQVARAADAEAERDALHAQIQQVRRHAEAMLAEYGDSVYQGNGFTEGIAACADTVIQILDGEVEV